MIVKPCLTGVSSVTSSAMEEVLPLAIKSQETTKYVVAFVLTVTICLTLLVAALELPTKFILP